MDFFAKYDPAKSPKGENVKLVRISPTDWESNTYLLVQDDQALLFDAGVAPDKIADALNRENATLRAVLLTHGHFDHILSVDRLREKYAVPVFVHEADAPLLANGLKNASCLFFGKGISRKPADRLLHDGEKIPFGNREITVLHTPGHTSGSVCYLFDDRLVSGDTLFANGCGRTDLPGGNADAMDQSLARLSHLPQTLTVCPGHGSRASLEEALASLGV